MDDRKRISIVRDDSTPRANAPWKLRITTDDGAGSSHSSAEYMSQGELLDLWNAIGVVFNLAGMGESISDDELRRRGIHIKTSSRDSL